MNQAIVEEITTRFKESRSLYIEKHLSLDEYVEAKLKFYKDYVAYPEEFTYVLQNNRYCYLKGFNGSGCPNYTCETCRRTYTHNYLRTQINHIP